MSTASSSTFETLRSWASARAKAYRRFRGIDDDLATAATVQAMVFGNRGETSASGVAFTRDPRLLPSRALRRLEAALAADWPAVNRTPRDRVRPTRAAVEDLVRGGTDGDAHPVRRSAWSRC